MKLIIASNNQGKIKEIRSLLNHPELIISGLREIGFTEDIEETGSSFYQNALIKAQAIRKLYPDAFVLSDDSGLEVDALNGEPGIYSARYAGPDSTQEQLINKLLKALEGVPFNQRTARFVCMMVLISPDSSIHSAQGICSGSIAFAPRGIQGFGYDPIFLPEFYHYSQTFAEIDLDAKNKISHRSRALQQITATLEHLLAGTN